jgi:hypothetical protein
MKVFALALAGLAMSGAAAFAAPVSMVGKTMIGPDGCLFLQSGRTAVGLNTKDEKLAPGMVVRVKGERFRGNLACMKGHTGVTVASWAPAKLKAAHPAKRARHHRRH